VWCNNYRRACRRSLIGARLASMTDTVESTELAIVGIGELVNLEDGAACARAIDAIRDLEWQLRAAKTELTRALVHQSQQAGSKTLRYEGVEAVVKGGTATEFDSEAIYLDLLAAGMSEQRAGEIVVETVSRKVSAAEAKRAAAANPAYAEAISRHTRVVETPFTVSVSVKKN